MTISSRVGGVWKTVSAMHVRVGGVWKTVSAGHVRVGGVWKNFFPGTLSPSTTFQVDITSSTNASTGIVTLTGINYPWLNATYLTYFFDVSSNNGVSWSLLSTGAISNPVTSNTASYVVTQADVTANVDNLYRFRVTGFNTTYSTQTTSTSATNVTINAARNISGLFTSPDTTFVYLFWTPGAYTSSYKVEYKLSISGSYTTYDHINETGVGFTTVSGLSSGTSYDFRLTPYTGVRINSSSSKGYYGNSSTVSSTTLSPPGDVTNGYSYLSASQSSGSSTNVSTIYNAGANYALVLVSTDDFVKDGSIVTISGATGSQSIVNGTYVTIRGQDRSTFYIYNPSGTWGSIPTQNYASGCTATYKTRSTPYTITLSWTPGANTTGYSLSLYQSVGGSFATVSLGAVSSYSFTSIGGNYNLKDQIYSFSITPYNGAIAGNTYTFYNLALEQSGGGNVSLNTKSAVNTTSPSFVKVSGYGTSSSPWEGDIYALTPGSWTVNGDGSAVLAVRLIDFLVDSGQDYLISSGFGQYNFTTRAESVPSFYSYQIPNDSNYGSPLYLSTIVANDSTLDAVFPGDAGYGAIANATSGSINNLYGPTSIAVNTRSTAYIIWNITRASNRPPYWQGYFSRFIPAVYGGNGVFTVSNTNTAVSASATTVTMTQTDVTKASWVSAYIYGYNNGVISSDYQNGFEYAAADPVAPTFTVTDFYLQYSSNTLYMWKIADTYTNTHYIVIALDRYVGGVYQNTYYQYFLPYVYTVTSNLTGYPNNPSNSLKYAWDLSSYPSGSYYAYLNVYNFNYGLGTFSAAYTWASGSNPIVI